MKLDRLMGILTVLLQNEAVTAPYLAEKFEVTRRTIGRDIDALCQAGIPIFTRQGSGGGISIAEGYKLDKSVLTVDELSDLLAAVKGLGSVGDASKMARMLEKLSAGKDRKVPLDEPVVIDLASHYKDSLTMKIGMIKQAVREHRLLAFDYYSDKGQARRRIEPYFVAFQWTAWYLFGFCTQRQDWRMFKLARLWEPELCGQTFLPRNIPPEKRDFDTCLPDDKKLAALFDPSMEYQLIEEYGPHCFTETTEGMLLLEIGYTNRASILSWLLSFGSRVRVLEPKDLAEEIRQIAEKVWKSYL